MWLQKFIHNELRNGRARQVEFSGDNDNKKAVSRTLRPQERVQPFNELFVGGGGRNKSEYLKIVVSNPLNNSDTYFS